MAQKKGNSLQTSSPFDSRRFISFKTEKKFNKFKDERKAIMREQALKLDQGDRKIMEFIRA